MNTYINFIPFLQHYKKIRRFLIIQFSALVSTIDNNLRNASAHNSIDYNIKRNVKLYDSKLKNRKLIKEIKYKNILEKYEKLNDLVIAIIFGYVMNLEVIYLLALDSLDFKFMLLKRNLRIRNYFFFAFLLGKKLFNSFIIIFLLM